MNKCAFCGADPYEYVNNGIGLEPVAVTCCELGCAVYDHRYDDAAEITVTSAELREIASRIAAQDWQIKRRDNLIEKVWKRRRIAD